MPLSKEGICYALNSASSSNFVDRDVVIVCPRPHGHATRATGLQSRCAAFLPKAIGRRWSCSAMLAAKQDKARQELPKSICQPWHVNCRFIRMGLAFPNKTGASVEKRGMGVTTHPSNTLRRRKTIKTRSLSPCARLQRFVAKRR